MIVWVYAICKNEEQFAERWMNSMAEADGVTVLDTGSEDQTVEILKSCGAHVFQEQISPWRFDAARNRSLELIPENVDICVCTDLDEVFLPGWRTAVEAAWKDGVNQLRYRYTWNFTESGEEDHVFYIEKIHARSGFRWVGAVHEVLRGTNGKTATASGVQLNHHPDRSKSRGQYLPLLELAVREEPENDRNCHYLGREYMYHGRWGDAIRTLTRHLQLPSSRWRDERCASMRYLARCFRALGNSGEEENWLLRAAAEAGWLREPWLELTEYLVRKKDWYGVCFAARRILDIRERPDTYISEARAWGSLPYDLLSLGLYYTGCYQKAAEAAEQALLKAPGDLRLQDNLRIIRDRISSENDRLQK